MGYHCSEENTASLLDSSDPSTTRSNDSNDALDSNMEHNPNCMLCLDVIMLAQERFKPCSCRSVAVHTYCALNDDKWLSRKCKTCHGILRQPPSISATPHPTQPKIRCYICGSSSTVCKSGFRSDAAMIRPCFCDVSCHHQCIASRVLSQKQCKVCGVHYRYSMYGSLWDFFMRYRFQYCFTIWVLLLLLSVAALAITKSVVSVERFSLSKLFLLLIGIVVFASCLVFMWMCLKYTIMRRIPRFNTRYRQITVYDYEQAGGVSAQSDRSTMKPQARLYSRGEISQEPLLSGDSTVEQLLSLSDLPPAWQISSTPIASRSQQAVFSFDSPAGEQKRS